MFKITFIYLATYLTLALIPTHHPRDKLQESEASAEPGVQEMVR